MSATPAPQPIRTTISERVATLETQVENAHSRITSVDSVISKLIEQINVLRTDAGMETVDDYSL